MFLWSDTSNDDAGAHHRWSKLDEMIVEALHASPRQKFTLHLYIPPITSSERAVSLLPRCNALELLDFVYYEDVVRRNQAMVTGPVLSESIKYPMFAW